MTTRRVATVLLSCALVGAAGAVSGALPRLVDHVRGVMDPAAISGATEPTGRAPVVGQGPTAYTVQPQPAPGSCHYRVLAAPAGGILPDPTCTPGATNPKVTPATLRSTICRGGYTASIRPPRQVTDAEKRADARSYGYTGPRSTAEYDHLISLELGGDPNDPRNLWVEPNATNARGFANPKDGVEHRLNAAVCDGRVSLAAAQRAIASNWTTAEHALGLR